MHNGLASAALLRPGDVALGISHSGQTRETIEMLAEAGSRGATTIALTSFPRSPLAELADIVLLTASQATTFRPDALSARHPQLVVLDLLYIAVAQRTHDRAHAAFRRTAQAVDGHKAAKGGHRMISAQGYARAVRPVLDRLVDAQADSVGRAADLIAASLRAGGVLQAFGAGHSEAFAAELVGPRRRAGAHQPAHPARPGAARRRPADVLADPKLERDPGRRRTSSTRSPRRSRRTCS